MKKHYIMITLLLGFIALIVTGCDSSSSSSNTSDTTQDVYDPAIDPASFTSVIDNSYLPFIPGTIRRYQGETEDGEMETITVTVLDETREVMGVTCVVVRDTVLEDGELIEDTYDWYAQDSDGNVWYFGEDSKEYEDGQYLSSAGSWEAGIDGAKPGIVMYADPANHIDEEYRQEYYAGEAEDMAKVVEVGLTVTVSGNTYTDCIKTEDYTPLEPDVLEYKYYAPNTGFILEEKPYTGEMLELVPPPSDDDDDTYDPDIDPEDFTSIIDNPYLPFTPGTTLQYQGETEDGEMETITVTVLEETREVMGVTCIVVRDTVLEDGELIEDTYDWYAQDSDGNVWYFGEDSKEYEDGQYLNSAGSWESGIDGAKPGIVMFADPADHIGEEYRQEYYAGEAEDMAEVVSLNESVTIGDITYTGCLKTMEWTPLEPSVMEYKYYASGLGLVLEENAVTGEMVELVPPSSDDDDEAVNDSEIDAEEDDNEDDGGENYEDDEKDDEKDSDDDDENEV